jgi:hypothetical protein
MKVGTDKWELNYKECSGIACWEGSHCIEWKKNVYVGVYGKNITMRMWWWNSNYIVNNTFKYIQIHSNIQWIHSNIFKYTLNTFKYTQILSNTSKYIFTYYKYIEIHHKCTTSTLKYIKIYYKYIKIHSYALKDIEIYYKYTI